MFMSMVTTCACIQLVETADLTNSFCLCIFGVGDI